MRHYTNELRSAKHQGAKIVCSMQPYRGRIVVHRPRRGNDPQPWVLLAGPGNMRFSGRECSAVTVSGAPWMIKRTPR
jgi:hypothetical protein